MPTMIFKFRMLSDENDHFVRDYEVPYDWTLLEFHRFLVRSLHYTDDGMASFFTADKEWARGREFTLVEMGAGEFDGGLGGPGVGLGGGEAPVPMADVTLGQLLHNHRDRLIYLFDMLGDRAYYLELTGAYPAEAGVSYPRIALEQAAAPDQYDPAVSEADGSIFDDVMGEFSDFEGDEGYDGE